MHPATSKSVKNKNMANQNFKELNFFCTLEAKPLARLFEDRFVLDDLKSLSAGVSLAMLDFSDERAEAIRLLHKLGIPVIAWLMLTKEDGYWLTLENSDQALARYADFKQWSGRKKLEWTGIGLWIKEFEGNEKLLLSGKAKSKNFQPANEKFQQLAGQIRQDGYRLEIYQQAIKEHARPSGMRVVDKMESRLTIPADRQVDLLFPNLHRDQHRLSLWRYLDNSQAIGLGAIGSGALFPELEHIDPLSWQEFTQVLRLAAASGKPIYVFNLEGCAQLGYLDRLTTFDVTSPQKIFPVGTKGVEERAVPQKTHALNSKHLVGLATLAGIIGGIALLLKRKKSK